MRARGAILRGAPGKYEVVELDVDDPRAGEVQVRMVAAGMCHSDDHIATGDVPVGQYPIAGGHEGAGIVTKAGYNTKGIKEGDHVVFAFVPSCGYCRWCASGLQNLCDIGANLMMGSRLDDASSFRLSLDGTPVSQMCCVSTFCETTTVAVESCIRIPDDVPLEAACLLGCGVGTGWGSAVYSAEVKPSHTVIVMGVGGVGMNAVQGAAHCGASYVMAVDPVAHKRERAAEFGATHSFATLAEASESAKELTNGQGADSVIITVGVLKPEHVVEGLASVRKAGTVVVTSVGNIMDPTPVAISLADLTLNQKRLQGTLFGGCNPNYDIPRQIELYRSGVLKLEELVTTTYSLDEVAQGYQDMHDGKNIRGVVKFDS